MKRYMKVNGGYRDVNTYIIVIEGFNLLVKCEQTGKTFVISRNNFIRDYIEI